MKDLRLKIQITIMGLAVVVYFGFIGYVIFGGKTYEVRVTYCDPRPPKTIRVTVAFEKDLLLIQTHEQAVPRYHEEVNVCEVKLIGKLD